MLSPELESLGHYFFFFLSLSLSLLFFWKSNYFDIVLQVSGALYTFFPPFIHLLQIEWFLLTCLQVNWIFPLLSSYSYLIHHTNFKISDTAFLVTKFYFVLFHNYYAIFPIILYIESIFPLTTLRIVLIATLKTLSDYSTILVILELASAIYLFPID